MEKKKKACLHCGIPISGRSDKQYCTDQCRANARNSRKTEDKAERYMKQVNQVLRTNRQILHKASPEGKTTLRRQVLELAGFDFRHFTSVYRTQKGSTYYFCYDYGYLLLPEEKVLIVNQQLYMG
ncbi:hypothetical protein [Adhaeribacter soli]|uniref:DUF2116 family Zn-ribbon domain-containing protein n=1 Tax=Adhaeribacter soli TaxID=2607655 RepID=A0A5N1J4Q1_9BACT|nr:hypothetical protein [Adhaeribacter soli]KAA9345886.1 hypothetical protein F0P94_02040 [Adhaeribacter soli]